MVCLILGTLFASISLIITKSGTRTVRKKFQVEQKGVCTNLECLYCLPRRTEAGRKSGIITYWTKETLPLLSLFGFVAGVLWIYAVSQEIISVLAAIGTSLGISEAFMGITLFAFGNSVGDLVTNLMVAKLGYYSMASGACFGAPLLNSLLTLGISGLAFQNQGILGIDRSPIALLSCGALMLSLISHLLILGYFNKFRLTLIYGVSLIVFVFVVMTINVTIEAVALTT
jgi:Ca2+/Na+ antiporter